MSKVKQEQFYRWNSIIPQLKKSSEMYLKQLRGRSIQTYPPEQFEYRKNKIRSIIQGGGVIEEEEYFDVFAFMIEERTQTSLLDLADQFKQNFGKQADYWSTKITQWANVMTFTNSLILWTVNQFMRNFVNYNQSPIQRDLIYQWRHKTQAYLSALDFLTKKIKRMKKTDSPYILDETYIKYHREKLLYITFINKLGLASQEAKSPYEEVTMTFQNKSKAERKLFNFPHATRTIDDVENMGNNSRINTKRSTNTLQKYNFVKRNFDQIQIPTDQQQRQARHLKFVNILQNVGKQQLFSIEKLRLQLRQQKLSQIRNYKSQQDSLMSQSLMKCSKKTYNSKFPQSIQIEQIESLQNHEYKKFPVSHFTFIHDRQDYFGFEGLGIGKREQIHIQNPFILYAWVNYYINDREQYEQAMAFSLDGSTIDDNSSLAQDQEQNENELQDNTFIDRRAIVTYDQNQDNEKITAQDRMDFAQSLIQNKKKWVADYMCHVGEDILANFPILPVYGGPTPYQMQGTDDPKTKRKFSNTKQKPAPNNTGQNNKHKFQQITENFEQDNQTTSYPQKQLGLLGNQGIAQKHQEIHQYKQNWKQSLGQQTNSQDKTQRDETRTFLRGRMSDKHAEGIQMQIVAFKEISKTIEVQTVPQSLEQRQNESERTYTTRNSFKFQSIKLDRQDNQNTRSFFNKQQNPLMQQNDLQNPQEDVVI